MYISDGKYAHKGKLGLPGFLHDPISLAKERKQKMSTRIIYDVKDAAKSAFLYFSDVHMQLPNFSARHNKKFKF